MCLVQVARSTGSTVTSNRTADLSRGLTRSPSRTQTEAWNLLAFRSRDRALASSLPRADCVTRRHEPVGSPLRALGPVPHSEAVVDPVQRR